MDLNEKEKKIKSEKTRLKALYKDIAPKKRELADRLIEKAAYQYVTLEELQADIDQNGFYEKFSQGKDQIPYDRRRPAVDAYTSLTSSYQKYMKQLTDLLPKEAARAADDGFEAFVDGRDD